MQLAARFAAAEMARLGVAPATAIGAEAVAARVSFEALRGAGAGVLRAGCPVPRLCPGTGGDAGRAAAQPRRPAARSTTLDGPARDVARAGPALRAAARGGEGRRSRGAAGPRGARRRGGRARAAAAGCRWSCSTCRSPRGGARSRRGPHRYLASGAGDGPCRRRRDARRAPGPDNARATRRAARRRRCWATRRRRPSASPPLPLRRGRATAGYDAWRRPVLLGARRWTGDGRDRAANPRRGAGRDALRRDGGTPARARSVRVAARGRPAAGGHSRLVRAGHVPARSFGARVPRAARLRAWKGSRRGGSRSTSRSGRCRRSTRPARRRRIVRLGRRQKTKSLGPATEIPPAASLDAAHT